jgi:hypothetical protein
MSTQIASMRIPARESSRYEEEEGVEGALMKYDQISLPGKSIILMTQSCRIHYSCHCHYATLFLNQCGCKLCVWTSTSARGQAPVPVNNESVRQDPEGLFRKSVRRH